MSGAKDKYMNMQQKQYKCICPFETTNEAAFLEHQRIDHGMKTRRRTLRNKTGTSPNSRKPKLAKVFL